MTIVFLVIWILFLTLKVNSLENRIASIQEIQQRF